MNRNKAYGIVISEFIKAINENKDNEKIIGDFKVKNKEELIEDLWHCVAQIEKIKAMFNN